jgi:hypothetical protein
MITIERMIQKVRPGKWAELEAIDKKYNAVERRLGYPPKKRYRSVMGGHDLDTVITERQWDSLAAMEATVTKAVADPELQALNEEAASIFKSTQVEVYMPLP